MAALALSGCVPPVAPIGPENPDFVPSAAELRLPAREDSAKFAVIGDSGTGGSAQYRIAQRMIAVHAQFPFEFVLMTGDNLYGAEYAAAFQEKFEIPYGPLLDAGVKFYASLGNHDETNQVMYEPFNMGGERFYTFKPADNLRFFALDSNYMSPEQLEWLEKELAASASEWKIAFFHHPMYSTGGRHGPDIRLREQLEPLFVKYGVDVVFAGHEHFYERIKPQRHIHHFVTGASAKLRQGDIEGGPIHAAGFDDGYHFMLVEVVEDELHFQAISDTDQTVDAGVIQRLPNPPRVAGPEPGVNGPAAAPQPRAR
jgi:hypothetical protein